MLYTVVSRTVVDPEDEIILVTSRNSSIQVLLDQEDDPELDDEFLNADERLTSFSKAREKIMWRVNGEEFPSVQGARSSEEDLVVRERVPSMT